MMPDRHTPALGTVSSGMLAGLLLAVITSAGLLAQRLSPGDLRVATAADALSAVVAIGVLALTFRPFLRAGTTAATPIIGGHAIGGLLGVASVHLALRVLPGGPHPWLSERPAQLVNDLVAVFGALAL